MLLAIDLGSTVIKAVVWAENGPVGVGRATLRTVRRAGGVAEQEPSQWWRSVVSACRHAVDTGAVAVAGAAGSGAGAAGSGAGAAGSGAVAGAGGDNGIRGIVFSTARQTFVTVDANVQPTGPGDHVVGPEGRC